MNTRSALMGAGIGAGVMYLLDPNRGGLRRARVRDAAVHTTTRTKRAVGTVARDVAHRTYGTAASAQALFRRGGVDDAVLVERVRAKLGRLVSHPHAIEVNVSSGDVSVAGPILEHEAAGLIHAISGIRGVHEVIDNLERHRQTDDVPSLQGGRAPVGDRPDVLQQRWSPATRTLIGGLGAAIAGAGFIRRDRAGAIAAALGSGLVARAIINAPVTRIFGVGSLRRAIDVQKTITINAAVGEVYAFWSWYGNFPRFMSRVLEVHESDSRPRQSHWKVAGPAGVAVEFDAETTHVIPNRVLAWKTLPGAPVAHAGIVRFDPMSDGATRVDIRMSYNPPAGWLGHGIAAAFGVDPKSSLDEDLVRMKTVIETGNAPHDAAVRGTQDESV